MPIALTSEQKRKAEAIRDAKHVLTREIDDPTNRTTGYLVELVLRFGERRFTIAEINNQEVRPTVARRFQINQTITLTDASVIGSFLPTHGYLSSPEFGVYKVTVRGIDFVEKVLLASNSD